ncbi:MAG: glucose-6-phosphate isomerase, partial [Muribaculaceae bacterium]|nr:glucose-6-phosphate isomerase [Muribaculaceae bacterium]
MDKISLNIKDVLGTVSADQIKALDTKAAEALAKVDNGTGAGNDFLGWVNLPSSTPASLLDDIQATADALRRDCEVVVAIGIGGSYLGAKAVIEALNNAFDAYIPQPGTPKVLFAGQNIGEDYLYELTQYLADKKFGIIVISKSGTTTEPAIAFRMLKEQLEKQLGKAEASRRIVAITDKARGALRQLATEEGYKTFV